MRRFQASGMRREYGFHAVTKTPQRAWCRASTASIAGERCPIRTAASAAPYRVRRYAHSNRADIAPAPAGTDVPFRHGRA